MPCDGQHVADGVGEDLGHDGSGEVLGVAGVGRDGTKGLSEFRKLKPTAVLKDVEVGEGLPGISKVVKVKDPGPDPQLPTMPSP